ncbi:hypothetical protein [Hahella ganghwensis]|uniref:hypothetical protein n=1 Tax=Hahella ganghwensis TaxID=286420 RepID=UPI000368CDE2|nr:hypothetical protein [Hahella ganghwensis]
MKKTVLLAGLIFSSSAMSAGWLSNQEVSDVGVKYGNGCVTLTGGEVVKINLTTDDGKAEYSLVLAALASGKTVDVHQTDGALEGGCGTGTTIKPHDIIKIDK